MYLLENYIDEESFHLLDGATIKELIPAIGPRLKFQSKFEDFKVWFNQQQHTFPSYYITLRHIVGEKDGDMMMNILGKARLFIQLV